MRNFESGIKRVLVISHFFIDPFKNASTSGFIRKYFQDKIPKVVQIEQPFTESKKRYSLCKLYEEGSLKKVLRAKSVKKSKPFTYLTDPFVAFFFALRCGLHYDLCIACDNLSFISMLPLRKLGLIRKLIYYSVDYVDDRFEDKLLNRLYHVVDRIACENSDQNWFVVGDQFEARMKNGIKIRRFQIVPIGFMSAEIELQPINRINYYDLVFLGGLRESAGPQIAISAMPYILKRFPKVRLLVIGGGEYLKNLRRLVKKFGLARNVKFLGMIESHMKIIKILTKCAIGLAPYTYVPGSISYKSDPGKIKLYLLCGLPIITTKIATSHKIVSKNGAGIIIGPDPKDLAKEVVYLFENRRRYLAYRSAAIELSKRFDADKIFKSAFQNI